VAGEEIHQGCAPCYTGCSICSASAQRSYALWVGLASRNERPIFL